MFAVTLYHVYVVNEHASRMQIYQFHFTCTSTALLNVDSFNAVFSFFCCSCVDSLQLPAVCFLQRPPYVTQTCWKLPCLHSYARAFGEFFNSAMCPTGSPDSCNWQRTVKALGLALKSPLLTTSLQDENTLNNHWTLFRGWNCHSTLQWNRCH